MSRALVLGGSVAFVAVAVLAWRANQLSREPTAPFEPPSRIIEPAALCPWREPEADLNRFFPKATRYVAETRILSGLRVELTKQLGRVPNVEESTLTLHRVFQEMQPVGAILARRVKGEHGVIELVLAVTHEGEVCGARLQRLREPDLVAGALQSQIWLNQFTGRTHERGWDADDLVEVPADARISAQAIRDGVRSLLILRAASEGANALPHKPHH